MIKICPEKDGTYIAFLNDWDLCKWESDLIKPPTQPGRSVSLAFPRIGFARLTRLMQGTWPYMSANLLLLPTKPNEVTDDLESIVYVVSEGYLRFQPHDFTKSSASSLQPPTDQEQSGDTRPTVNDRLATYIATTFYEANVIRDKYAVGGQRKYAQIKAGEPEFLVTRIKSGQLTETEVFLWKLYGLLQEHYAAILDEALAPYRVSDQDDDHPFELDDEDMSIAVHVDEESLNLFNRVDRAAAVASTVPVTRPDSVQAHKRVLDTHDEMVATFVRFLVDERTKKAKKHVNYKKTKDQFEGLPRNINVVSVGPSSGSVVNSRSRIWSVQMNVPTLDTKAEADAQAADVFAVEQDIISQLSDLHLEG
jgi:hypothetical protein